MIDGKPLADKVGTRAPLAASRCLLAMFCFVLINLFVFQLLSPTRHKGDPDLLVAELLKNAKNRTFSWWTARAYEDEPSAPDLAIVGSSQMASATFAADAQKFEHTLDVLTHRRASTMEGELKKTLGRNYSVFNCAQGGFMISDAYLMSRALFAGGHKPKVVIIGVSPRDFMDNTLNAASTTEPFQFYSRCVDLGKLASKSFASPLSRWQWMLSNDLPLRWLQPGSHHESDDKKAEDAPDPGTLRDSQVVQALSDIGGDLKPGLLLIPANIPRAVSDNTKEYEHRYRHLNLPVYRSQLVFFRELLDFLKHCDIKVIVVGMPTLWPTREILPDKFWQGFRLTVARTCDQEGARWLDLMDASDFEPDEFLDTVHLNAWGGAKLFGKLAAAVAGDKEIAASLKQHGDGNKAIAGSRLPAPAH